VKIDSVAAFPAFVIVDAHLLIRYVSAVDGEGDGELMRIVGSANRLLPEVETVLRALPPDSEDSSVHVGLLSDHHVLRVVRVVGSDGWMFVLSIEEDRHCLERAARRHQLTRREIEVLSLILDGSSAGEIADTLALSEHTVQGYFKRLLSKTGARNRVSMVAGLFDWGPGCVGCTITRIGPSPRAPARIADQTRTVNESCK
jgi:DNA-binding CsgD family transcriptional regulator